MIVFGFEPYPIKVVVAAGSTFTTALETTEPWPPSTAVTLRFLRACSGTDEVVAEWPATVDDRHAVWDVEAAAVSALVQSGARVAHLFYDHVLWGKGRVDVVA